jgi:hypothetical protein
MKACAAELFPPDLSLAGVAMENDLPLGFYTLEVEDACSPSGCEPS